MYRSPSSNRKLNHRLKRRPGPVDGTCRAGLRVAPTPRSCPSTGCTAGAERRRSQLAGRRGPSRFERNARIELAPSVAAEVEHHPRPCLSSCAPSDARPLSESLGPAQRAAPRRCTKVMRKRQRGTVIVLVLGVLVILAMLGTTFATLQTGHQFHRRHPKPIDRPVGNRTRRPVDPKRSAEPRTQSADDVLGRRRG